MSTEPNIPLPSEGAHGVDSQRQATATCYCGSVQVEFPVDNISHPHICNCTDCHKISASMFCSNFVIDEAVAKHTRGRELLSKYATNKTVGTGNTMENNFCKTCGTLMYRIGTGFPGKLIMRIGTVDDFSLMDTILKPEVEQFVKDRTQWCGGAEKADVKQVQGYNYG